MSLQTPNSSETLRSIGRVASAAASSSGKDHVLLVADGIAVAVDEARRCRESRAGARQGSPIATIRCAAARQTIRDCASRSSSRRPSRSRCRQNSRDEPRRDRRRGGRANSLPSSRAWRGSAADAMDASRHSAAAAKTHQSSLAGGRIPRATGGKGTIQVPGWPCANRVAVNSAFSASGVAKA